MKSRDQLEEIAGNIYCKWLQQKIMKPSSHTIEELIILGDVADALEAVQREAVITKQAENVIKPEVSNRLSDEEINSLFKELHPLIKHENTRWALRRGYQIAQSRLLGEDRCPHGVHGKDCFKCYPSEVK